MKRIITTILFMLLAVICGASQGQEKKSWLIECKTPAGYFVAAQSDRRLRWRKDLGDEAVANIVATIVRPLDEKATAADYLASSRPERESVVEGTTKEVTLGGLSGAQVEVAGPTLGAPIKQSRKIMVAAKLEDGQLLALIGELIYPGGDLPTAKFDAVRSATLALLPDVKAKPADASSSGRTGRSVPDADDKGLRFTNDAVLPISFKCPEGWFVSADQGQVPGSVFLLASPERDVPPEQMKKALRVSVYGYVPELTLAADPLARGVEMVKAAVMTRLGSSRVEIGATSLVGSVKATTITYEPPPLETRTPDGMLLVAVADAALVIAEITWPERNSAAAEAAALSILNSFQIDVAQDMTTQSLGDIAIFDHPASWGIAEAETEDGSHAVVLQSFSDMQVIIRCAAIGADAPTDPTRFDDLLVRYLVDEVQMTTREAIRDITPFRVTGARIGRRILLADAEGTSDVFAFLREGILCIAAIIAPDGIESHDFGQAMHIITSIRPPNAAIETDTFDFDSAGRVVETTVFGATGCDAYDAKGSLTGGHVGRLTLFSDGRASYTFFEGPTSRGGSGTYEVKDARLTIRLTDGTTIAFDHAAGEPKLQGLAPKLPWYRLP